MKAIKTKEYIQEARDRKRLKDIYSELFISKNEALIANSRRRSNKKDYIVINEGGVAAYALGAPAILKVAIFIKEKIQNPSDRTWKSLIDPHSSEDKPVMYTGENTPKLVLSIDKLTGWVEKLQTSSEKAPSWEHEINFRAIKGIVNSEEDDDEKKLSEAKLKAKLTSVLSKIKEMHEKDKEEESLDLIKVEDDKIEVDLSTWGFAFDYLKSLQHSLHHLITTIAGVPASWFVTLMSEIHRFVENDVTISDKDKEAIRVADEKIKKILQSLIIIVVVSCMLYPSIASIFGRNHSFGVMDVIDLGEIVGESLFLFEEGLMLITPAILQVSLATEGGLQIKEILKVISSAKLDNLKTNFSTLFNTLKDDYDHVKHVLNKIDLETQSFKKSEEIIGKPTRGMSSSDIKELTKKERVNYLVGFLESKGKGLNTDELLNKLKDNDVKGIRNFSKNAGIDVSEISTEDLLSDYVEAYKTVFGIDPYIDYPIGQKELNNSVKEALIREYISSLIKESYDREIYFKKAY